MSKTSSRSKKARSTPQQSRLPAILSAITVVAVFVVLGVILANSRPGATTETASAPADSEQTAAFGDATDVDTDATTEEGAVDTDTGATTEEDTTTADGDTANTAPTGLYDAPPEMSIDPDGNYQATIETPRGDILIQLRPDLAPESVNNFVFLAQEGYYDGLTWHRVLEGFMAQGGDPVGDGSGGPGYTISDEFTSEVLFDRPGIVAMARPNAPDSAGSQFFITTAPAEFLNEQYTIFGEVLEGQSIVDGIPLRDPDTNPTEPGEEIVSISIQEG
ncbi:MAG: Peptidyl-prolyl cis-trans isomerase (rotamase) - cyclophilin family [Chloroflexi bacterium AL-W]|nr:Peptidyl-prolyl cis-trans isomerase (rotamase) - cyclophilin family [Chloroflexi bacterium AL-N1]NOK65750.1 Peptidyl-prolyl cis-trans isomerase (rotamase) - cyclophilin family [Chloroflexi bacterium AL-N10]NOK74309.1 Peptidyl-prolyl cis-trans isomerase (rotamase) - cyclophilin family [Chloroflexi bacterium AL-N5]NOK80783.1 Peptidyl-prolyl cis-trans isomerase (rotamase) - cyclophilin family [Chloroflexi bacterium AL-W]NOK88567.1 Peptidyl-prolyl cis-trans isomerase (rotamase) - cyclophilin fam